MRVYAREGLCVLLLCGVLICITGCDLNSVCWYVNIYITTCIAGHDLSAVIWYVK